MNLKAVLNIIFSLVFIIGLCMLTAVPVSWHYDKTPHVAFLLFETSLIPILIGVLGYFLTRHTKSSQPPVLAVREGFGIVTFGWIAAAAFGCLPFVFVSNMHWYDAFFETMSGFTTTGSSVIDGTLVLRDGSVLKDGIPGLSKGILYWRSMTHWLGGMGIVVLSLAILPFLGIGGQQLYNAEVPGFIPDQLTPRIASSAKILWGVYVLLSIVETLFLLKDMSLFDAWCHTCGTMATGGFSTLQGSVGEFASAYVDWVITIFMFLAGCNFILHFRAIQGKPLNYFKDEEFRFYLWVTLFAAFSIATLLYFRDADIITTTGAKVASDSFMECMRYSAFQVVSIMTTTGFATADFNIWPVYAAGLLVVLMFIGGCGGSTGGGIKHSRFLLLLKYGITQIRRCLFPRSISNVRINSQRIDSQTVHKVLVFFFLFIMLFVGFALLLPLLCDMDITTAATASVACLANIGPGLEKVGATASYAWMTPSAKLLLTLAMLLGRLEVFTVLVVFLPSFWRR